MAECSESGWPGGLNFWPSGSEYALITLFDYPDEIRKVIYTTNAIESLNSVIRKSIKKRKLFPNDNSAIKVVFLACESASKKWTMSIQNWKLAMSRFIPSSGTEVIEFEEQLAQHIN